ncbi:MAG: hypothetical protein ACRCXK_09890 [Wohlfahrtiimonas sp.]
MKIITILSLCLTASLSFANSEILDKDNNDAFTYDYSHICEQLCFRFTLDTAYDPYGLTNPLIDPFDFSFQISLESDPEAEYIKYAINKFKSKMKYGFPSTADANAYFNIYILNNTLNNQLGHLRWITELAHRATNDNTIDIQVSKNSHLINFGTQIIESLIFVSIQNPFCTTQFKPCSAQIIDTIIIQPGLKPKPKRVIHDF